MPIGKARLGFDIGSSSIKVAVLQGDSLRVEEARLPENMVDGAGNIALPHAFAQFLKQLRKELSLPRCPASLVLPSSQVICRLVTMPRMTTAQLMMNLPYEFTDFIQGVADQYFCDYALCTPLEGEDGEQGVPMMAAAAAKQTLADYSQMFAQAGVRLRTILPQEMALIHLVRSRGNAGEEYCFVDLGHQSTRITVIRGDRVQATRQIALGGRNLDLAVADSLGVDAFLANTYKTSNYQDIQSSDGIRDVCDRIAVEILKVINFYQFTYRDNHLEGLYLAGGGAALPYLCQVIQETVSLPVLPVDGILAAAEGEISAGLFAAGAALGGN